MSARQKIHRNERCPCLSGMKFKHCCLGLIPWQDIWDKKIDPMPFISVRGRNLIFLESLAEILQLGTKQDLITYKTAFTATAVRRIHEAVLKVWPPNTDILSVLKRTAADVSGIYVGDYQRRFLERGIVRHSLYANKILVVDPFLHPLSVNDKFNPILSPDQYRTQTLTNVNFWISLRPWIDAGIVEVIRTPADFDIRLQWDSHRRQETKFEKNKELREALESSISEMNERHESSTAEFFFKSMPDSAVMAKFHELNPAATDSLAEDFLDHIQQMRDSDPNFLAPLGPSFPGQMHMFSAGTSYDLAKLTAQYTRSYLVTDISVRWKEIELDRSAQDGEMKIWSPFAHAMQETQFRVLNSVEMKDALMLRSEGRLSSMRSFLTRVWKDACNPETFANSNPILLAEELRGEVEKARVEWKKIDQDLLKIPVPSLLGALGSLAVAPSQAQFLAAVGASAIGIGALALSTYKRHKTFPMEFPASFFMNVGEH